MKQWYFSHDGEVRGPLALAESNQFIAENPDSYAWHPSFNQWVPVTEVDEFDLQIAPPPPPGAVPRELVEQLYAKESELYLSIEKIEENLVSLEATMIKVGEDINNSKTDTQSLNQEVNDVLRSINDQYEALQKRVAGLVGKQK